MRRGLFRALPAAAVLMSGCVRTYDTQIVGTTTDNASREPLRSAGNLPAGFTVVTAGAAAGDCPIRLRDDGIRTVLTLARTVRIPIRDSAGTVYVTYGDYRVQPAGAYGDTAGEGLRVNCAVLRPLGVVQIES